MRPFFVPDHPPFVACDEHARAPISGVFVPTIRDPSVYCKATYHLSRSLPPLLFPSRYYGKPNFFYLADIRDYLDEIFVLIEKHWNTSMLIPIINLVEEISLYHFLFSFLWREFKKN
jgi:hypothetical protein